MASSSGREDSKRKKGNLEDGGEKKGKEETDKSAKTFLISLSSLPPELLMMVASFLDPSSYLALSISSTTLLDVLAPQYQWKTILMRMKAKWYNPLWARCIKGPNQLNCCCIVKTWLVYPGKCLCKKMLRLVLDQLTDVLKIIQDPDNSLLLELLHFICDIVEPPPRHLATSLERYETLIALACPCLREHIVSPSTFSLLEKVEISVRGEKSLPLQRRFLLCRAKCETLVN